MLCPAQHFCRRFHSFARGADARINASRRSEVNLPLGIEDIHGQR